MAHYIIGAYCVKNLIQRLMFNLRWALSWLSLDLVSINPVPPLHQIRALIAYSGSAAIAHQSAAVI